MTNSATGASECVILTKFNKSITLMSTSEFTSCTSVVLARVDRSSDALYEKSLKGEKEIPQVVYLTHSISLDDIYHLRLGLSSFASKPYSTKWYLAWMILPLTYLPMMIFTFFWLHFHHGIRQVRQTHDRDISISHFQNWLPRRVMSGWRVGGIVHALEGWDGHECGREVLEPDRVWKAALGHGFLPLIHIRYSMASPNLVEISPTVYVWHRKI
ncbi:hypothetical protein H6P81_020401 [Aristolochia fimbriata]|uniref:Very-long-chain aldehyde decarbonylase CER1-like C-terminal domain-containing protein n=1 Tax=Aristolochia fimbriata TaxID=158543 RepID=A0AAV7DXC1_ARIFI|nr:hypothetical protein H6P81_020401 [Aristolochia fimbriata]